MSKPSNRKPVLSLRALGGLRAAKQEIMDAAVGKMPQGLMLATVAAVVHLARRAAVAEEVLSERVLELVRESLKCLAQQKWKLDTALLLKKPSSKHQRPNKSQAPNAKDQTST